MKKINIAMVIPTYNRVDKLKVALSHIEAQEIADDVKLHCVISNTASTDSTYEFLNDLKSDKVNYIINNTLEDSIYLNWKRCSEIIPEYVDWVWFHGDDDFLFTKKAVQCIVDIVNKINRIDLTFIHACQARRSRNSGKILEGSLLALCNEVGYHEMLGWMSSLVVRRDRFKEAFGNFKYINNHDEVMQLKVSAYAHSAFLLESCCNDYSLFVDLPLVEPQDEQQTEESIQRWAVESMGERYFYVIDDLINLKNKGVIKNGCSLKFFRYLNGNLWDRYVNYILTDVVAQRQITEKTSMHLQRLSGIMTLLKNPGDMKLYSQMYFSIESLLSNYLKSIANVDGCINSMNGYLSLVNTQNYTFEVLGGDEENYFVESNPPLMRG